MPSLIPTHPCRSLHHCRGQGSRWDIAGPADFGQIGTSPFVKELALERTLLRVTVHRRRRKASARASDARRRSVEWEGAAETAVSTHEIVVVYPSILLTTNCLPPAALLLSPPLAPPPSHLQLGETIPVVCPVLGSTLPATFTFTFDSLHDRLDDELQPAKGTTPRWVKLNSLPLGVKHLRQTLRDVEAPKEAADPLFVKRYMELATMSVVSVYRLQGRG